MAQHALLLVVVFLQFDSSLLCHVHPNFWRVLSSYIGQLEILAVLFAYLTLPSAIVRGRRILHYIDNTSAIAGSVTVQPHELQQVSRLPHRTLTHSCSLAGPGARSSCSRGFHRAGSDTAGDITRPRAALRHVRFLGL